MPRPTDQRILDFLMWLKINDYSPQMSLTSFMEMIHRKFGRDERTQGRYVKLLLSGRFIRINDELVTINYSKIQEYI